MKKIVLLCQFKPDYFTRVCILGCEYVALPPDQTFGDSYPKIRNIRALFW